MRLLLVIILNLLTFTHGKLLNKSTDKPIEERVDMKPDVIAKHQNGAQLNYFNSRRTARSADDKKPHKNSTNGIVRTDKDKVLVKKPIPKYHDVNSDEDYQGKYKWPLSQDSAEHEDEDFNINDYEFDVNHDEFVSGRKPLEPRIKIHIKKPQHKPRVTTNSDKLPKSKLPRSLVQRKVVFPKRYVEKVTRNAADKMKEEDYDQEFSTSTEAVEVTTHENDDDEGDDESDEFEDSKDVHNIRTVRSPWDLGIGHYMERFGEKTVNIMSKFLSHLPIFPQAPNVKKVNDETFLNEPVQNPFRARQRRK